MEGGKMHTVTCSAPVNIAVIKYCESVIDDTPLYVKWAGLEEKLYTFWCFFCFLGGKRDEELVLPVNSSLSVTLSQDQV